MLEAAVGHPQQARHTIEEIISTVLGELRRNNLAKLAVRVPAMILFAIRRMSRPRPFHSPDRERITGCACDLHARP